MGNLKLLKRKRWVRLWRVGVNNDAEAIVKRAAGTGVLFVVIRFAVYWKSGQTLRGFAVLTIPETAWVVFFIIAGWLIVSMISSAIRVARNDRNNGYWENGKRIYFSPQHVFTKQVSPGDHGQPIIFKVRDAEPNTYVQFDINHHGGKACGYIVPVGLRRIFAWGQADRNTTYDVAINQRREAALVPNVPANSDPTIIEINMLSWQWQEEQTKVLLSTDNYTVNVGKEPPDELIAILNEIKPDQGFVEITRHDKLSFSIAEKIDKAFAQAGWITDFKKGIGHRNSPHSKFGIEVIGADPDLVHSIVDALNEYGMTGVKPNIAEEKQPVNKVTVRIGVGD